MSAPTPPPGFDLGYCDQTTAEMGRAAQEAYRVYCDEARADRLADFLDAALDVLERITGQSVPPSTTHPDVADDGCEPDGVARARAICRAALTDYVDDGEPVLAQAILDALGGE